MILNRNQGKSNLFIESREKWQSVSKIKEKCISLDCTHLQQKENNEEHSPNNIKIDKNIDKINETKTNYFSVATMTPRSDAGKKQFGSFQTSEVEEVQIS